MPRVYCDNNTCLQNRDLICCSDEDISLKAIGGDDSLALECANYDIAIPHPDDDIPINITKPEESEGGQG